MRINVIKECFRVLILHLMLSQGKFCTHRFLYCCIKKHFTSKLILITLQLIVSGVINASVLSPDVEALLTGDGTPHTPVPMNMTNVLKL